MLRFHYPTPFGIPLTASDAAAALRQLQHAGRLAAVTRASLAAAIRAWLRDGALLGASGRWDPGERDPVGFVPGDIGPLRAITTRALLGDAVTIRRGRRTRTTVADLDLDRLLRDPGHAATLVDVYSAVPHFVVPHATLALLTTRPPGPAVTAGLRMPWQQTLVVFGCDVPVSTVEHPWPTGLPLWQLPPRDVVGDMITRGGHVSGVVVLAEPDGRLRDDCIWLLAANPDPGQPFPASVDHPRKAVRGWRSAATFHSLVEAAAAAAAGAIWQPPPPPAALSLPASPFSARWATLARDERFRRFERRGGVVGAHVLDFEATTTRAAASVQPAPDPPPGEHPAPLRPGRFVWSGGDVARPGQQVVWVPPQLHELPSAIAPTDPAPTTATRAARPRARTTTPRAAGTASPDRDPDIDLD